MLETIDILSMALSRPFVQYALIVSVLVALCSSLLGVTLVLKRFAFIGHGLSNVAFGSVAIATALHINNSFLLSIPVTVICAILLMNIGKNSRINADAAIAMISVGTLAIGYLVMNMFPSSANISGDVCSTLFGGWSILTLTTTDMWVSIVLSILVSAVFLVFYHKIFSVTFDEDFATATGTNANTYNLILSIIIALVIVLAINVVGTLLISALVIFPALTAMRVFSSFKSVTICSVVVAIISAAFGLLTSIPADTPVGSTIVAIQIIIFFMFWIVGGLFRKFVQTESK